MKRTKTAGRGRVAVSARGSRVAGKIWQWAAALGVGVAGPLTAAPEATVPPPWSPFHHAAENRPPHRIARARIGVYFLMDGAVVDLRPGWNTPRTQWTTGLLFGGLLLAGAWIRMVSHKNRLLEAAQAALREAREELERRVQERTAELADTNAVLQLVQAEVAARQRTEEERDRFFSLSVDMLCICGSDGFHRRVSPAFTRILGWTEPELLARPFMDFVHLDDRPALRERIRQVISGQPIFDFEFRCLGKDGSYRWTAWTASPVDPDGLFYGCGRDISERKKTEKQLQILLKEQATSLSLLNATLESTADGILVVNLAHKVVCYNQKFVALWGLPAAIMETRNETEVVAYVAGQICDSELLLDRFRRLREDHELETYDVVPLKDGRVFERFLRPQRVDDQCVGAVISYRDITERQQAQAQLEAASRQAGMAEVATNVLHNVGNVLNSVNISMSVIEGFARVSQAPDVLKLVELLGRHRGDLAEFLMREDRAEKVVAYLRTLADHLASDQTALLEEVKELTKSVDHIKDIVAMQQGYATVMGMSELVAVAQMVDDALAMHTHGLARHEVRVVREYAPDVPSVTVEKHKLIQILVNLIRNAQNACDESGRGDKRLTVRLTCDAERVFIAVIDNGVGIPAENLTKIFTHGFTTRKKGHGFGLHSAALAAREMRGALRAHSDGPGRGATFILELPRRPAGGAG